MEKLEQGKVETNTIYWGKIEKTTVYERGEILKKR